jgi:hypothetical protein
MMNYSTLVADRTVEGSIRNWINNPNVPATAILSDAEADIYTRIRVREMRTASTVVLTTGASNADLPEGFLDPITLRDKYRRDLVLVDPDGLENIRYIDTDFALVLTQPSHYSIFDEKLQFDCRAEEPINLQFVYFRRLPALAGGNETNFLTSRYSPLVRFMTAKHAAIYLKDDAAAQRYEMRAMEYLETIKVQDDLSYRSAYFPER